MSDQPTSSASLPVMGPQTPTRAPKTRTIAIIKPHALKHRLTIEPRITEAGFEIIKERMTQFDPGSDMEYLQELFGDDATTLIGEPIWVYVLERHRAVEVWNTLMGNRDPAVAKETAPNSLRAVYGKSVQENAFAGPPDNETAEKQIAALFEYSPPFAPVDSRTNSLRSIASSILSRLRDGEGAEGDEDQEGLENIGSDEGYSVSVASTAGRTKRLSTQPGLGKAPFKARLAPSTTHNPISQPRMTKAAQLRAGIAPTTVKQTSGNTTTFVNVPGHKRAESIKVASTAEPVVAPRLTKAASLRMGIKPAARPKLERPETAEGKLPPATFEGVPGHKRRESIAVSSTKEPTVVPRPNRSALLRQSKETASAGSYMFKPSVATKPRPSSVAGISSLTETVKLGTLNRRQSISVASAKEPTIAPRLNKSALLRTTSKDAPPSSFKSRPPLVSASNSSTSIGSTVGRPGLSRSSSRQSGVSTQVTQEESEVSDKVLSKPSAVVRKPSIEPRTNRSALLRANSKENEAKKSGLTNGAARGRVGK